jgi:pantoate--beta-alanine ligase
MKLPESLRTAEQARAAARKWRRDGDSLALVPTMGALHEGHLSLAREGRRLARRVAFTIFVNPMQFGPQEDLAAYPRDLAGDLAKCASAGVDAVFIPEAGEIYPAGFQTHVEVERLSQGLCGERRPGHFRGVATVVAKLLILFDPDVAVFGRKDYQQLRVVERLARDLGLATQIVGAPIVREVDGLAMSSRNAYLEPEDRRRAVCLHAALRSAQRQFVAGERDPSRLCESARAELERGGARVDYVELCTPAELQPVARAESDSMLLLAAFVGTTRLIDNAALGEPV